MKAEDILKKNNCNRSTILYDKYGNQLDGDNIINWMEEYADLFQSEVIIDFLKNHKGQIIPDYDCNIELMVKAGKKY